ncbi:CDP-alcohol phosphatidyltransferase family protein [Labilithrix luteola]|uniref:CDP-alcohol phosphatidyltransferase family protein n=1 Tax=Labilithrix luteola TaxID=1391654 RepID=UPI0011BA8FB2|nr:CDP-alcohol phosphatidyltransferase family protein [Labilithrix luteola]
MGTDIDTAASVGLCAALAVVLAAFAAVSIVSGPRSFERLDREAPLPLVGKAPMEAVYAALGPVARFLVALRVSANAVTIASFGLAVVAAVLFAFGHFGLGAVVASTAALADALDGLIARQTRTASKYGQVLDTTIDRYVEALFIGGIAIYVRHDLLLLLLALGALVGGFMVSYASSVLRELAVPDPKAPMRRAERLSCLLVSATLVPFVASAGHALPMRLQLGPIILALATIAVVGNVSALRRLLRGARVAAAANPVVPVPPPPAPAPVRSTPSLKGPASAPASKRLRHP